MFSVTRWFYKLIGSTFWLAILSGLLLFASLPPFDLWPLAWVAPLPWLLLIERPTLPGRRPLRSLYLASVLFWIAALHWLVLPHWGTSFGLLAIAAYLALYPMGFVLLSRVAVHRFGWSIVPAAPLVWMGLDVARGYIFGGFTFASIAHTQYRWIEFIQVADIGGSYLVGGIMLLVSACAARIIMDRYPWLLSETLSKDPNHPTRANRLPIMRPALVMIAAYGLTLGYGYWRTMGSGARDQAAVSSDDSRRATVALIQGSFDTSFDDDPDGEAARIKREHPELSDAEIAQILAKLYNEQIMQEYGRLTWEAKLAAERQQRRVDLYIWPESMFRYPLLEFSNDYQTPPGSKVTKAEAQQHSREAVPRFFAALQAPVLVGLTREVIAPDRYQRYNSCVFVAADGRQLSYYDKMHLVMFGEYVPLFDWFPSLYAITPMGGGLSRGEGPISQSIGGVRYSPSICYESAVPHLIRDHVRTQRADGFEPDVLVNLTNDGWFWGSSALDLHLVCSVFRAVENRKPVLIAANTGFSATIDSDGKIIERGPRRAGGIILADVRLDGRQSIWSRYGGWLELLMVGPSVGLGLFALRRRRGGGMRE